jgi:hypothetical protein
MTPELSRRLGAAFAAPDLPTGDRVAIVAAAQHADVFTDLPENIQRLVQSLEEQISSS